MTLRLERVRASMSQAQMAQALQRWAEQIEGAFNTAKEYMADLPPITITADYTGAVSPSAQLPKTIICQRFNDGVAVDASWSAATRSDGVVCTIDAATGALTITGITGSDTIDVTSVRAINGQPVSLAKSLAITFTAATAPASGTSGGSTATVSLFYDFNSTTPAVVATITATAGASGNIQLSAPLSVTTGAYAVAGTYPVHLVWHDSGGDLGSGATSSPSCRVNVQSGQYIVSDGSVSVSYLKTGLTPGNSYSFDLMASNSSGSRDMSLYGQASAVGS